MTTILSVRRNNVVVMGGDGQATIGDVILKHDVKKVRFLYNKKIIAGFSGNTSDSFTLFELFEKKLETNQGQLIKSAVELSKYWRSDKILRRLEAMLAVVDYKYSIIITGNGDIVSSDNNLISIGSGGIYAQSAALALLENTNISAIDIVNKSLDIASNICIYTNKFRTIEILNY